MLLEVCVDSPRGLQAAIAGGADRIELCSSLALGGLSPSPGLVELARRAPIPVYAMVRPRPGDFVFDADDEAAMLAEVDALRGAGLAGVVLGANRSDGTLDAYLLTRLVNRARGMGTTLHRAFDLTPDLSAALETAVELGFERVLSSGARRTAIEGADVLSQLAREADGRIAIMPGSGVNAGNVGDFLQGGTIHEVHASCRSPAVLDPASRSLAFGFQTQGEAETDMHKVAQLRGVLSTYAAGTAQ